MAHPHLPPPITPGRSVGVCADFGGLVVETEVESLPYAPRDAQCQWSGRVAESPTPKKGNAFVSIRTAVTVRQNGPWRPLRVPVVVLAAAASSSSSCCRCCCCCCGGGGSVGGGVVVVVAAAAAAVVVTNAVDCVLLKRASGVCVVLEKCEGARGGGVAILWVRVDRLPHMPATAAHHRWVTHGGPQPSGPVLPFPTSAVECAPKTHEMRSRSALASGVEGTGAEGKRGLAKGLTGGARHIGSGLVSGSKTQISAMQGQCRPPGAQTSA